MSAIMPTEVTVLDFALHMNDANISDRIASLWLINDPEGDSPGFALGFEE
jgi:hypothetical protein